VGYVDFRSYFTTPLNLDLLLHGSEDKAVPVTGAVAGRLSGSTEPAETRIMLDEEPLKDLLSIWPREMYSDGHIVVNDGMTEREIARTDSLESRLHIEVPLHMIIAPDIDTLDVMGGDKIDEDTRDDINKRCRLGRIVVGCRNHFPLAFSITAMAGNDSAEIFENPEVIFNKGEDFYVAPAIIDDNGISVDKSEQIFDTDLTMEEIKALCSDEKIYMGIILNKSGTGGKPVKILHDDYLEIRAHLEVKLLVGE
jgi:hypothetical protein